MMQDISELFCDFCALAVDVERRVEVNEVNAFVCDVVAENVESSCVQTLAVMGKSAAGKIGEHR